MTSNEASPIRGEVWVMGRAWAATSYGIEALNGSCSIPAELLSDATLTHAVPVMSKDALSEFVSVFATALMLHGLCPMVRKEVVHEIFGKHLAMTEH